MFDLKTQMDEIQKMVDIQLRNQVKYLLQFKKQTTPFILKENVLFDLVKRTLNYYSMQLGKQGIGIGSIDFVNINIEIADLIFERFRFYFEDKNDNERLSAQSDERFKSDLAKTIGDEMVINKNLGAVSMGLRMPTYAPLSKMMIIVNLLYEVQVRINGAKLSCQKSKAVSRVFVRALDQLKSMILLFDSQLSADAITIWRSFYETELTLIVLSYWPEGVSSEYLLFTDFQLIKNNVNIVSGEKEEIEKKYQNKLTEREVKDSVLFVQFGWLMQTREYWDNDCKLNLKEGLAVVADKRAKYKDYSMASAFSHFSGFTAALNPKSVYRYGIEVLSYSLESVITPVLDFIEEFKISIEEGLLNSIKENLSQLKSIIEHQKNKKSMN